MKHAFDTVSSQLINVPSLLLRVDELYRRLSTRPGGIDDFQTLSWLQKERSRLQALKEAAMAGSSKPQPPTNMDSVGRS